jgi:hypothetical protein
MVFEKKESLNRKASPISQVATAITINEVAAESLVVAANG